MKLIRLAVLAIFAGFAACSSTPAPASTPAPREPRVTYSALNVDLKTVIDQIARQGNLSIILDSGVTGRVSLSVNDVEPREVLAAVAKTFDLRVTEERPGLYRVSPPR